MPELPMSQISARIARSNAPQLNPNLNPDAFGAGIGRAVQEAGASVQDLAGGLQDYNLRKQKEKVANAVAQGDFTPYEVEARASVGPDAAGYRDTVLAKYDEWVEGQANAFQGDDMARMELRRSLLSQRDNVSSRAALYEEAKGTEASKLEADASLFSLRNKVVQDPSQYDTYKKNGLAVLATRPGMTAGQVAAMNQQFTQDMARARFTGMIEQATSAGELDQIRADLEDPKKNWAGEFNPTDYDWVSNAIDTTKSSMLNLADSNARAAIATLDERNNALANVPEDELRLVAQEVKKSRDPIITARFSRIVRDQQYIKLYKGASPEELQAAVKNAGGVEYPGLSPEFSTAVNIATQRFDVDAGFLGPLVQRESGGDPNATNSGGSSATGLTQFTDSTFLDLVKNPRNAARMGIDVSGKSDAELLELRKDPDISIMAAAAYGEQNRTYLENKLGRNVNNAELYMAHFLGPQGAADLLNAMKNDPSASAASIVPNAAASNHSVFYHKKGKAKSVNEVYNEISRTFTADPSQVQYGDVKTLSTIQSATEKALDTDPMKFAQESGKFDVQPLTDTASYALRGNTARSAANYYTIPEDDFKPLTGPEVDQIATKIATGTTDDALAIMANIQGMGGKMAQAAFKQIGEKDKVYAYAAGLASEGGSVPAASDVIRGRKRLEDNPALKQSLGEDTGEVSNMFTKITGGALMDVAPDQRQAIQDAALAHYAETYLARGGTGLDEQKLTESVNAVMGGTSGTPVLANVNGAPTVLPPGITGDAMNTALDSMAIEDWIALSPQKTAPMYITGEIADPRDLADEAQLRSVGGGQYKVMLDDGSFLTTGVYSSAGRLEAFLVAPTAPQIAQIVSRRAVPKPDPTALPTGANMGVLDPALTQ